MSASSLHTLATFRARFPHAPADDVLLQEVLDAAAVRTPPAVWGTWTREGHGYLAAHTLGMEPSGRDARLQNHDGQTTYGVMRRNLERSIGAAVAPRVT